MNPRKHSFITLLISPSLFPFIIESCNSSQHFTIQYSSRYISLCQWMIPIHCMLLLFYVQYPNFLPFTPSTFFPSFLVFSPNNHFHISPPPPFHSLTIYSRPSRLVITLRKSQSEGRVMLRWVPVEVFIEMCLYRDWSCLLSPRTQTANQTLFPLSGDPLSWTQCIQFHGELVILQRFAIIGICRGAQCVCWCSSVCVLESETEWERLDQRVQLGFDLELCF